MVNPLHHTGLSGQEARGSGPYNQAERRCREHLTLIDMLLAGQEEAAADFMRLHLRNEVREKSDS